MYKYYDTELHARDKWSISYIKMDNNPALLSHLYGWWFWVYTYFSMWCMYEHTLVWNYIPPHWNGVDMCVSWSILGRCTGHPAMYMAAHVWTNLIFIFIFWIFFFWILMYCVEVTVRYRRLLMHYYQYKDHTIFFFFWYFSFSSTLPYNTTSDALLTLPYHLWRIHYVHKLWFENICLWFRIFNLGTYGANITSRGLIFSFTNQLFNNCEIVGLRGVF